ncbi:MAG TPA: symmetrical bis(5'-nucleosyl)-tetraphosphatase [Pseudomonadales bacterium]
MAIYAVGDLQGCLTPLQCLLEQVQFDPARDTLWCTGDLVNRGPQSLETLRFVYSLGDACVTVLGNHDLHLLAVAAGKAKCKRGDTLDTILDAPDRHSLLDWLRRRPLLHHQHGYTLVHAGIAPQWTLEQAMQLAGEVEQALRGDNSDDFFAHMYGNSPRKWKDELAGFERLRVITNYFTRMRFCNRKGKLDLDNKQGPEAAESGTLPWFEVPERRMAGQKIIFGHWAALEGRASCPNIYPLDTGCVWGGRLTLMRLSDEKCFSCHC